MIKGFRLLFLVVWLCVGGPFAGAVQAETQPAPEVSPSETLTKELAQLETEQQRLRRESDEIGRELQQAPGLVKQMRLEIARLEKESVEPRVPGTVEALEAAIAVLDAQVKAMQINLTDVMDRISELQALPTIAREQVSQAQSRIQQLQDKLATLTGNDSLEALRTQVTRQQIANTKLRMEIAQNSLDGYQKLLELYTVNRDLLLLRMGSIKAALGLLRGERDALRQKNLVQEQQQAAELQTALAEKPLAVLKELDRNTQLTVALANATTTLTHANDALADGKQELQDIRYRYEMAEQQLQLTEFHQYVDDYLLRLRQTLQVQIRDQRDATDSARLIAETRLQQFRYDDELQQIRTAVGRQDKVEQLLAGMTDLDDAQREEVRRDLLEILAQREDMLGKLVETSANHVVTLTKLELLLQEQLGERVRFFDMLNRKLLWRRSGQPMGWDWLTTLPQSVRWFVVNPDWKQLPQIWLHYLLGNVLVVLALLVVASLLLIPRQRALARLSAARDRIGNVMKDRFRYTAEALFITLYLSAPLPLLVFVLGVPLAAAAEASLFVNGVGQALMAIARWVLLFEFVRHLCRHDGLAPAHFSWRPSAVVALQRWMPMLYWQLPFAFVFIIVWRAGDESHAGTLGRAAYLLMAVLFLAFVWRLMNPRHGLTQRDEGRELHWYQQWNHLLFGVALLIPSVLILLALTGFNFSAMMLHTHLYQTFMFAFMIFVLDQVCTRWFAVQERKIALDRALAKREAMKKVKEQQEAAKSTGEGVPEIELPSIDVATISEQNRTLLRVVSYGAFIAAVVWIWQDLFQAANVFGEIVLWSYSMDGTEGAKQIPVTLGTLIYTAVALVLTYIGVKNLPGLIEVVVLQRFSLDSGIRFAITTTARYLVMIGGVMLISSMIGLDWGKLGWLVAALGVGLGFGLQEIFANFISGLIILYERPIRIGDTVTINDLSGTVSRIRMRATTIVDWDQKELIIPNKTFVTSQFINWTLSDSTTRLVVKVGVVYGSDTNLVTRTLLEIANANDKVKREPAPTALFLGFGASDLQFELRVFIEQFNQRMVLLHELNTEINRRFNELNIEIAFPQMDLHIKDVPVSLQPRNS